MKSRLFTSTRISEAHSQRNTLLTVPIFHRSYIFLVLIYFPLYVRFQVIASSSPRVNTSDPEYERILHSLREMRVLFFYMSSASFGGCHVAICKPGKLSTSCGLHGTQIYGLPVLGDEYNTTQRPFLFILFKNVQYNGQGKKDK